MPNSRVQAQTGVTLTLARFAAELEFDLLPDEVTRLLKNLLLDSVGTTLAAGTLGEGCSQLVALARNLGGTPESTLFGYGDKVPALTSALVMGGLMHALNYDAVGPAHLGLVIPAAIAAAERTGSSGRELIAALAAACEIAARMALAIRTPNETLLAGQVGSYVAAAAGAGRIMRLRAAQMNSAYGLAVMQAAGSRQISVVGGEPPAKAIYGAFPNHGGMLAAELAALGLGAECDAIEGQAGFYAMFYGSDFESQLLTKNLGRDYSCLKAIFKPWPVSGVVTPFVESALELYAEAHPKPADIMHIRLHGGPRSRGWLEPAEERRRPANAAAAANSAYFAVSKVLTNGHLTLADFSDTGLHQPESRFVAGLADHVIDENLGKAAVVELKTVAGEASRRIDLPLGSPERPMSDEQLVAKFLDCGGHAAKAISISKLREAAERIQALEDEQDVRDVLCLLN
jgi:2-methylcitrate dehydratase PrpD